MTENDDNESGIKHLGGLLSERDGDCPPLLIVNIINELVGSENLQFDVIKFGSDAHWWSFQKRAGRAKYCDTIYSENNLDAMPWGEGVYWIFRSTEPLLRIVGLFDSMEAQFGENIVGLFPFDEAEIESVYRCAMQRYSEPLIVTLTRDCDYLMAFGPVELVKEIETACSSSFADDKCRNKRVK